MLSRCRISFRASSLSFLRMAFFKRHGSSLVLSFTGRSLGLRGARILRAEWVSHVYDTRPPPYVTSILVLGMKTRESTCVMSAPQVPITALFGTPTGSNRPACVLAVPATECHEFVGAGVFIPVSVQAVRAGLSRALYSPSIQVQQGDSMASYISACGKEIKLAKLESSRRASDRTPVEFQTSLPRLLTHRSSSKSTSRQQGSW